MRSRVHIHLICPVRARTAAQDQALKDYVGILEEDGYSVYFPGRDTGIKESPLNVTAIMALNQYHLTVADEVHVFWDTTSKGSHLDLGMAIALNKPLDLANEDEILQHAVAGNAIARLLLERGGYIVPDGPATEDSAGCGDRFQSGERGEMGPDGFEY